MTDDDLPPTQYLVMEVLAARYRLGETYWTFPTRCRPAAHQLEVAGLVTLRPAVTYGHFEARLTVEGRVEALGPDYVSPIDAAEERGRFGAVKALRDASFDASQNNEPKSAAAYWFAADYLEESETTG